ncbi:MAG: phosphoribosylanthranilate isomerase, partial [Myxococcaceae bacterium]
RAFDWSLVRNLKVPLLLAGGLTPENVAAAVKQLRPYAVDVASGVESSPGIKSRQMMERFITTAKLA